MIRYQTDDEGVVSQPEYTLTKPSNGPNDRDHLKRLGLQTQGTPFVTYADERREERPLAGPVVVQIGNRSMTMDCIVGPPLSEVFIGQVVLERLDLIADCTNRTLTLPLRGLPAAEAKAGRLMSRNRSADLLPLAYLLGSRASKAQPASSLTRRRTPSSNSSPPSRRSISG